MRCVVGEQLVCSRYDSGRLFISGSRRPTRIRERLSEPASLLLEAEAVESQCAGVLADGADDLLGRARGQIGLDLERHPHPRAVEPFEYGSTGIRRDTPLDAGLTRRSEWGSCRARIRKARDAAN